MKKVVRFAVILTLISVVMVSCGNNGGGSNGSQNDAPMQYTVTFSDDFLFPVKSVKVFECAENGDKIYENEFISGRGQSKTFTAQPMAKKVKVYLSLQNPLGSWDSEYNGWLPLVYYLSPNEAKVIKIDNNVEQHRQEP